MRPLDGRVGVITGASAGIGAAIARALAAAGMRVVLGARRRERLAAVCDDIRVAGDAADFVVTDVRDEEQVEALIDTAVARFGTLDTLVNNAAIGTLRAIADGHTDEWRSTIETNLLGTLMACRAALRHMLPRGHGDILNVTSGSAHEAWPYLAVYTASKAAIHTLSAALRAEVAGDGVRIMTIEIHGVGGTEFLSNFDPAVLPAAFTRWQALGLVNRRSATLQPEDIARAVVFQLSQPAAASVHHLVIRPRGE
jgi:NADP-dependent 3-hydroxy acid dehydrogenase YdfG